MDQRLKLHEILCDLLGIRTQVYFQPPASVLMKYPAIVYELDDEYKGHADNIAYRHKDRWQITVIDTNPDTLLRKQVSNLPMSSFSRAFQSDNLNHYIYSLYF